MITFSIKELKAVNIATILDNGDTLQPCLVTIQINGIVSQDKTLTELVDFTIPNSVMADSAMPTVAGWTYIKEVLAPEWIAVQYSEIS